MSKLAGKVNVPPSRLWSNPEGRIDLRDTVAFGEHRSGWAYCMKSISGLHKVNSTLFDDFLEMRFSWHLRDNSRDGVIPYRRPWVGVLHNPPNMPEWLGGEDSPRRILGLPQMRESIPHCRGLYVLSEYLRQWLAPRVPVPVAALTHPTEPPSRTFSFERYTENPRKKLIQVGYWLRRLQSLARLRVEGLSKVWLITNSVAREYFERESLHCNGGDAAAEPGSVEHWRWVDHDAYDRLLEANLVFIHLYDASASNTIVECIARHTPILVNPLPAVVEYLGPRYPFYFQTLEEAAIKAKDPQLVRRTTEYLRFLDKRRFSGDFFRRSIERSEIYRSLPHFGPRLVVPKHLAPPPPVKHEPSFDRLMRVLREEVDSADGGVEAPALVEAGAPGPARARRVRPRIAVACVRSAGGQRGGAERLYEGLADALESSGVEVELLELPADESHVWGIERSYLAFYDMDLSAFDGVVSTKSPSYAIRHRNHVCYLPHTMRQFYDMFDDAAANESARELRDFVRRLDTAALGRPSMRALFVVGTEVRDRLLTYNRITAQVLHHPTTLETRHAGRFRHLLLPGRLHPWKRIDLVLKAVRRMRREVELIISGEGEDGERLRALAEDLPRVRLVGHVSDNELGALYADALAVLNCSIREDYGLTTIEAFSSGKPVVTCTDSGETARLVRDGINGFVCEPDADAIAGRLDALAEDRWRAEEMGRRGREAVADISWPGVCETLLHALDLAAAAG